jgi:hypothetical protein
MIDDDQINFDSLKNYAAQSHQIQLFYKKSLEEGLVYLKDNKDLLGVILDGRGHLKQGQNKGDESDAFVHESLTEIKLLEQSLNLKWGKIVYTAWKDKLDDTLEGRGVNVYSKQKVASDADLKSKMFNDLKHQIKKLPQTKLREKYAKYFSLINRSNLKIDDSLLFFVLIKTEENKDPFPFNNVRSVLEAMYKSLNKEGFLPNDLFQNKSPNLTSVSRYLRGMEVTDYRTKKTLHKKRELPPVPRHIGDQINYLHQVANNRSHQAQTIGFNTYKSCVFALLSFMDWCIDNNKLESN